MRKQIWCLIEDDRELKMNKYWTSILSLGKGHKIPIATGIALECLNICFINTHNTIGKTKHKVLFGHMSLSCSIHMVFNTNEENLWGKKKQKIRCKPSEKYTKVLCSKFGRGFFANSTNINMLLKVNLKEWKSIVATHN